MKRLTLITLFLLAGVALSKNPTPHKGLVMSKGVALGITIIDVKINGKSISFEDMKLKGPISGAIYACSWKSSALENTMILRTDKNGIITEAKLRNRVGTIHEDYCITRMKGITGFPKNSKNSKIEIDYRLKISKKK